MEVTFAYESLVAYCRRNRSGPTVVLEDLMERIDIEKEPLFRRFLQRGTKESFPNPFLQGVQQCTPVFRETFTGLRYSFTLCRVFSQEMPHERVES